MQKKHRPTYIWIGILLSLFLISSPIHADAAFRTTVGNTIEYAVFTFSYTGTVASLSITSPSGVTYDSSCGAAYKASEGKIQIGLYTAEAGSWKVSVIGTPDDGFHVLWSSDASYGSYAGTSIAPPKPTPTVSPTSPPAPTATPTPVPTAVPTSKPSETAPGVTDTAPQPTQTTRAPEATPETTQASQTNTTSKPTQTTPQTEEKDPTESTVSTEATETTVVSEPKEGMVLGIAQNENVPPANGADQNTGFRIPELETIFIPTKEDPFNLKLMVIIFASVGIVIGGIGGVALRGSKIKKEERKRSAGLPTEISFDEKGKII